MHAEYVNRGAKETEVLLLLFVLYTVLVLSKLNK